MGGASLRSTASNHGMSLIPLITPSTSDERLQLIDKFASTFCYCLSQNMVTGSKAALNQNLGAYVDNLRKYVSHKLAVGFGIRNRSQVVTVTAEADAAVVGSELIRVIKRAVDADPNTDAVAAKVEEYVRSLT